MQSSQYQCINVSMYQSSKNRKEVAEMSHSQLLSLIQEKWNELQGNRLAFILWCRNQGYKIEFTLSCISQFAPISYKKEGMEGVTKK